MVVYLREAVHDAEDDDEPPEPHVDWRHLGWLLRLLVHAMVQEPQYELRDDEDEDQDADDLMWRVKLLALLKIGVSN